MPYGIDRLHRVASLTVIELRRAGACPATESATAAKLLQLQILLEAGLHDRASRSLASVGLTIPDVVRILLIRIAQDGVLPADLIDNK